MTVEILRGGQPRFGPGLPILTSVLALVVIAIAPALIKVSAFWAQAEYSHAWLIAPLAILLYLHRLPSARRGGARWGGTVAATGAAVLLLTGWATRNTTLSIYGCIVGIGGLTWAALGRRALGALAAPIAFLVFMLPLPLSAYITLSQAMQLLSSKLGVLLMTGLGVVVTRDGNVIELANGRLEVAEACNGLRYLFPLLSISFLLAVLIEEKPWKKVVLFASAVPVAIGMNAVRLAMIGVLVDRYGMGMAEGLQHEVEGFVVFALCVGVLLLEVRWLARAGANGRRAVFDVPAPGRRAFAALAHWPSPRPFLFASIVLGLGAIVVLALPKRVETIPDRRPLSLFPMTLASWHGIPHPLDAPTLASLGLTDYVMADYLDPAVASDTPVNFYVAYYESQGLGVQVHSPRLCIPGGGWNVIGQTLVDVPVWGGSVIKANRVVIAKRDLKQIVYYWFEERGRRLTGESEIKVFALVDGLMRDRSDGALVRLVTQVNDDDEAAADRSLQSLTMAATRDLRTFVPD